MKDFELEKLAPIILFTYNRYKHTKRTIEALQKNIYAINSIIFIYSDGAKNISDEKEVNKVRNYLKKVNGFREIKLIFHQKNQGLANSVIDGVTKVINQYGRAIVLEDDIVTSHFFLKYMNKALELYKDKKCVMQISGYMYPIEKIFLPELFFVRLATCWGWATWKDRWEHFSKEPNTLLRSYTPQRIFNYNYYGTFNLWEQIVLNAYGKLHTWFAFWHETICRKNGLVLYPKNSLVKNIGFDGSGENCKKETFYYNYDRFTENMVYKFPQIIQENLTVKKKMLLFFKQYFDKKTSFMYFCKQFNKIVCYGAGKYGNNIALFCEFHKIPLFYFIISPGEVRKEKKVLGKFPVYSLNELEILSSDVGIVVGVNDIHHESILQLLKQKGFNNIFLGGWKLNSNIKQFFYQYNETSISKIYIDKINY